VRFGRHGEVRDATLEVTVGDEEVAAHVRHRRSQYREITVGLTQAQYEYLREEALNRTTSIAQLVRELLQEELPRFPEDVSRE